jgi:very-short-patch-repair endonuclease
MNEREIIDYYFKKCNNKKEIGKLGVSVYYLESLFKKRGLKFKGRKLSPIFKNKHDIEMILSMYYSGASYREIADLFSCKLTAIHDLNRRYVDKCERQEAFKERQSDIGLKGAAAFKKKLCDDPIFARKMSDRIMGEKNICKLPGIRQKILEEWALNKDKRVSATLKAMFKQPTSFEKKILKVVIENNLPYLYCGDGSVVIGGKCPDFIHKIEKVVVEVFDDFHRELAYGSRYNYCKARIEHFSEFGYKTLFVPEEFVHNEERIVEILSCSPLGEQEGRGG